MLEYLAPVVLSSLLDGISYDESKWLFFERPCDNWTRQQARLVKGELHLRTAVLKGVRPLALRESEKTIPFSHPAIMLSGSDQGIYVLTASGEEWYVFWCGIAHQVYNRDKKRYLFPSYDELMRGHLHPGFLTRWRRKLCMCVK